MNNYIDGVPLDSNPTSARRRKSGMSLHCLLCEMEIKRLHSLAFQEAQPHRAAT